MHFILAANRTCSSAWDVFQYSRLSFWLCIRLIVGLKSIYAWIQLTIQAGLFEPVWQLQNIEPRMMENQSDPKVRGNVSIDVPCNGRLSCDSAMIYFICTLLLALWPLINNPLAQRGNQIQLKIKNRSTPDDDFKPLLLMACQASHLRWRKDKGVWQSIFSINSEHSPFSWDEPTAHSTGGGAEPWSGQSPAWTTSPSFRWEAWPGRGSCRSEAWPGC